MIAKLLLRLGAFGLVLSSFSPAFGQAPPSNPRAELIADQIMKSFYEKLDFGDVFREWFVRNPKIRQAEIDLQIENFLAQGDHFAGSQVPLARNIDRSSKEKAYIAWANFHWNASTAFQTQSDDRALRRAGNEVWKEYYEPFNQPSTWPILTSEELDQRFTARFIALADFFRGKVVRKTLGTLRFKKKQSAIVEDNSPDSIEHLIEFFSKAGMTTKDHLFLARRGTFYIYLVEEDDQLRMLSMTSRIRD